MLALPKAELSWFRICTETSSALGTNAVKPQKMQRPPQPHTTLDLIHLMPWRGGHDHLKNALELLKGQINMQERLAKNGKLVLVQAPTSVCERRLKQLPELLLLAGSTQTTYNSPHT